MLDHDPLHREFGDFLRSLTFYIRFRLHHWGLRFEKVKNFVVDVLLAKRGANTSVFVHFSVIVLAISVLAAGGFITSGSVVSGSYPGVAANPLVAGATTVADSGIISSSITPVTVISDKPRDKVLEHEVKAGETVSSIAQEFGVSENTILWENDLISSSKLTAGGKLRILPVSGVEHKVVGGDTIYSIAKTYQANSQGILDFPFNDIGDDFSLKTGQILIIPDGAPPEKPKQAPTQYLASAQQNISITNLGSAQFIWPASGLMAQYFSWYHPGLDISNMAGGPITASDAGTVTVAGWPDNSGYGNRIVVDHGNGFTTLYAHLSVISVTPGQKVSKGQVMGMMGSTGRSTGTHLHVEVRQNGSALNPLSVFGK